MQVFVCTQFKCQNSSIWLIDRTHSGTTTPGQSGPGSDGNEEVLYIPQRSSITGTSPFDCLVSHPWHPFWGWGRSYPSAEMQCILQPQLTGLRGRCRRYSYLVSKQFEIKLSCIQTDKKDIDFLTKECSVKMGTNIA